MFNTASVSRQTQIFIGGSLLAAALAVSPAMAAPNNGHGPTEGRNPPPTAPSTPATTQVDKRQYCVVSTITGWRLPRRICRTRADWALEGIDLDQLPK